MRIPLPNFGIDGADLDGEIKGTFFWMSRVKTPFL